MLCSSAIPAGALLQMQVLEQQLVAATGDEPRSQIRPAKQCPATLTLLTLRAVCALHIGSSCSARKTRGQGEKKISCAGQCNVPQAGAVAGIRARGIGAMRTLTDAREPPRSPADP